MSIVQFLLNADGSWPEGTTQETIDYLIEHDVPLVRPTPQWAPAEGCMLQEAEPQPDEGGVWRQVWIEVPIPQPDRPLTPTVTTYEFARAMTWDEMFAMRELALQSADAQCWIDAVVGSGYAGVLTA